MDLLYTRFCNYLGYVDGINSFWYQLTDAVKNPKYWKKVLEDDDNIKLFSESDS